MLPLYGVASYSRGFASTGPSQVLRMCSVGSIPSHEDDVALVKNLPDIDEAERIIEVEGSLLPDGALPGGAQVADALPGRREGRKS